MRPVIQGLAMSASSRLPRCQALGVNLEPVVPFKEVCVHMCGRVKRVRVCVRVRRSTVIVIKRERVTLRRSNLPFFHIPFFGPVAHRHPLSSPPLRPALSTPRYGVLC